jgi:hypothetical protein
MEDGSCIVCTDSGFFVRLTTTGVVLLVLVLVLVTGVLVPLVFKVRALCIPILLSTALKIVIIDAESRTRWLVRKLWITLTAGIPSRNGCRQPGRMAAGQVRRAVW